MELNSGNCTVSFYCADQNPHRDRSRGITEYTYGLLSHLREMGAVKLSATVSNSSFKIPVGIREIRLPFRTDHLPGRLLADHFHALISRRETADIWHYPKGFLPSFFQASGKKVGSIADVMLQYDADHHPESRSKLAFVYWIGVLKQSIPRFDIIVTISEFSKRAILAFCDRHQLKCPPIFVTYQGVDVSNPGIQVTKGDYVIHLASKFPYKGTHWLLRTWIEIAERRSDLPVLVLVGDLDLESQRLYSRITRATFSLPLPRAELEEKIAGARALLLPSEIEGFGRAVVEGYLLGTPVVYSKGTALEEIIGYGSPGGFIRDTDSFEVALQEAMDMDQNEIKQKAMGLGESYSWKNCVRRMLDAYSAVH